MGGTDLSTPSAIDYIYDTDNYEYIENILRSRAWFIALLRSRFVFLGLGERVHAVLQIGVVNGLLLYVLIEM